MVLYIEIMNNLNIACLIGFMSTLVWLCNAKVSIFLLQGIIKFQVTKDLNNLQTILECSNYF